MVPVVKKLDRIPSMNFFIFILFLFINDTKIQKYIKNSLRLINVNYPSLLKRGGNGKKLKLVTS